MDGLEKTSSLFKITQIAKDILTAQDTEGNFPVLLGLDEYTNPGSLLKPIVYTNIMQEMNSNKNAKHYLKTGGAALYFLSGDSWDVCVSRLRDAIILSSEEDLNDAMPIPLTKIQKVEDSLETTDDMLSDNLGSNPWYVYFCIIVIFRDIW